MIPTDDFEAGDSLKRLFPTRPGLLGAMADWLPGTWFNWTPAKPPPTEEEKSVHRAISVGNGDAKRFGHGQFIGDDE